MFCAPAPTPTISGSSTSTIHLADKALLLLVVLVVLSKRPDSDLYRVPRTARPKRYLACPVPRGTCAVALKPAFSNPDDGSKSRGSIKGTKRSEKNVPACGMDATSARIRRG